MPDLPGGNINRPEPSAEWLGGYLRFVHPGDGRCQMSTKRLTYKIRGIIMGHNIQSDAAKEVDNFARIAIIGRLAAAQEEQFITKVEYLRRGLVERYHHGLPLRDRVTLQRRHQVEGGVRVQAGRWFLKQANFSSPREQNRLWREGKGGRES